MDMIDIRIVQEKDPETVAKLNRYVQEKHRELFPDSFKPYNYSSVFRALNSFLDKADTWSFIAYFQEKPVGYATVYKRNYEENPFRRGFTSLVIDQMCVEKEFRRKGVGGRLVTAIREFAEQINIDKLELTVWSQNSEAKSFYKKMGFHPLVDSMRMEI
jgi:GNAT superfamily N-acetyltransferase